MTREYSKRKIRKLYAKATTKLLCPKCKGKSLPQLLIAHNPSFPLLVRGTCEKCGYSGSLLEISLRRGLKR